MKKHITVCLTCAAFPLGAAVAAETPVASAPAAAVSDEWQFSVSP